MAEGARLEIVCRGNSTEGSNPSLSANPLRRRPRRLPTACTPLRLRADHPRRTSESIQEQAHHQASAERCRSGRTGRSRKPLTMQVVRGFESHPLRHISPFGIHGPLGFHGLVAPRPLISATCVTTAWRHRPNSRLTVRARRGKVKVLPFRDRCAFPAAPTPIVRGFREPACTDPYRTSFFRRSVAPLRRESIFART